MAPEKQAPFSDILPQQYYRIVYRSRQTLKVRSRSMLIANVSTAQTPEAKLIDRFRYVLEGSTKIHIPYATGIIALTC
jgi:hypothetical protein